MIVNRFNKLTFLLFCVFSLNLSYADWAYIAKTEMGDLYLDTARLNRFSDMVEAVILENLNNDENGSRSILSDISYDCRRRTMTVMTIQRFPMKNAKGKIMSFDTYVEGKWRANIPVSNNSKLFPKVCDKYQQLPNNN